MSVTPAVRPAVRRLIVGLGNIGPEFHRTRHNVGFAVCKLFASEYVSKMDTSGVPATWKMSKGTPDIPWYVHEVPTIFISLASPFHLADVPQVKTYINCYDKNEHTLDALVEKLLGRSEFAGTDPVDSFCGMMDTRI